MDQEVKNIIDSFAEFTQGCRVQVLLDRKVNNSHKGSRRWHMKMISNSLYEFEANLEKLLKYKQAITNPETNLRIYSTVNDRNLQKAVIHFKHRQIDLSDCNIESFYTHIQSEFVSCLCLPENRHSRYFLLDIDTKNTSFIDGKISMNNIMVCKKYETPNGWHYITGSFDRRIMEHVDDVTVLNDGLLLLV